METKPFLPSLLWVRPQCWARESWDEHCRDSPGPAGESRLPCAVPRSPAGSSSLEPGPAVSSLRLQGSPAAWGAPPAAGSRGAPAPCGAAPAAARAPRVSGLSPREQCLRRGCLTPVSLPGPGSPQDGS